MQDDIPLIDDEEDIEVVEGQPVEEKEVVELRPSRGSVRGGVTSLPLPLPLPTTAGHSAQSELSPDVFQIRAPIVSLESLILSPASTNLDIEPIRQIGDFSLVQMHPDTAL